MLTTADKLTPSLPSAEAEHTPSCRVCGHPLTAEASVRRGIGPVCARHEVERVALTLRGGRDE
ncbi:DUF6011 domain-containing protein [Ornithinimicrobium sp. W1665]|uniref:DUF6011 domain-containing protein n=1 Tax=Ornithinimicrobium sp. W1665 TaxID=3416666 RepID=UPI003CF96177